MSAKKSTSKNSTFCPKSKNSSSNFCVVNFVSVFFLEIFLFASCASQPLFALPMGLNIGMNSLAILTLFSMWNIVVRR